MVMSNTGLAVALTSCLIALNPVFGPGRAIGLGLRSLLAKRRGPESLRVDDVAFIRRWLVSRRKPYSYLVLVGEKGVGKTLLLYIAYQVLSR